jgi:hypothetical protein
MTKTALFVYLETLVSGNRKDLCYFIPYEEDKKRSRCSVMSSRITALNRRIATKRVSHSLALILRESWVVIGILRKYRESHQLQPRPLLQHPALPH